MATQRPIKSLSDLMDGGVEERFNAALAEVWENVYDPNTDAKKPREVNLKIKITPNERRDSCDFRVSVVPKLAPKVDLTQTVMLTISADGSVVATERTNQVPDITFGRYMDTELFNTQLLSKFIDTPARAELFRVIKSMTKEQGCTTTDDGISQVITTKQGVSMAQNVVFQNPVPLKPMRTFTEVDQPESNFTLRVDEDANCALYEADGGAWKNEAVINIHDYLKNNLYGQNIVVLA